MNKIQDIFEFITYNAKYFRFTDITKAFLGLAKISLEVRTGSRVPFIDLNKVYRIRMKNGYNIDLPLTSLIDLMELIKSRKSKIKILNNYILVDEKDKIPIRYIKTGLYAYLKGFRYNDECNVWEYKDDSMHVKFSEINYTGIEIFSDKIYNIDKVSGDVLDIGGNIGASAIYFAKKGAKKVILVEPLPNIVKVAKRNIDINNLSEKIVIINAALGIKNSILDIPADIDVEDSRYFSTNSVDKYKDSHLTKVPVITMKDVFREINEPYLLKMDCEGCEYDVIPYSYDLIKMFKIIFMELHGKKSKRFQILKILEHDFDCKILHSSAITTMIKCEHK